MLNRLMGIGRDPPSSKKRRQHDATSSSSSRRRAESASAAPNPDHSSARPSRATEPRTTHPPGETSSMASSYATARTAPYGDEPFSEYRAPLGPALQRSTSEPDRKRDRHHGGERRKDASSGHDRSRRNRDDSNGGVRDKDRREKRRSRREEDVAGVGERTTSTATAAGAALPGRSRAPAAGNDLSRAPPGLNQSLGDHPSIPDARMPNLSSHISAQFPGQNPSSFSAPFRPGLSVDEGGPGLAAEYYGDQGQSVAHQPGVRPQPPSVIVGAEPHLMSASPYPAPPPETGSGAAQDYFGGPTVNEPEPLDPYGGTKINKPSKTSGASAALGGAAAIYALNHVSSFPHGSTGPIAGATMPIHSASAPAVPTLGAQEAAFARPQKHGKQSSHGRPSEFSLPIASAAGLAAGAHAFHHHAPAQAPAPLPSQYGSKPQYGHDSRLHGAGPTLMRQQSSDPLRRLVDWWKDHEDVRKMEEYTEYIGVCRNCFDPRSTPADAPRKHHYQRRRSSDFKRSRVDKESRYHSSDNDGKHQKGASWIASGIAGYGLAKIGGSFVRRNRDFDDTYSVKSGRKHQSQDDRLRRVGSSSSDRPIGSNQPSRRREGLFEGEQARHGASRHSLRTRRSRSRSRSADRTSGLRTGLLGAAVGASAAGLVGAEDPIRAKSSRTSILQGRLETDLEPASFSANGLTSRPKEGSRRSTESSASSIVETSNRRTSPNQGIFGGLFTPSPKRKSKTQSKRKTRAGFFGFGGPASSSESDLAYGSSLTRRSRVKKTKSDEKLNATLIGLGATAAALAAANNGRAKPGKPMPEVVAVRESKRREQGRSRRNGRHETGVHSSSADDDDDAAWESASDDESSSLSSGLAFGEYGGKGGRLARDSRESLASEESGTGKWRWRWGSKRKNRVRPSASPGPANISIAGQAANGTFVPQLDEQRSGDGSMPPLRPVYAVPTAEPNTFDAVAIDADMRDLSVSSNQARPNLVRKSEASQDQPHTSAPIVLYYDSHGQYHQQNPPPVAPVFSSVRRSENSQRLEHDNRSQSREHARQFPSNRDDIQPQPAPFLVDSSGLVGSGKSASTLRDVAAVEGTLRDDATTSRTSSHRTRPKQVSFGAQHEKSMRPRLDYSSEQTPVDEQRKAEFSEAQDYSTRTDKIHRPFNVDADVAILGQTQVARNNGNVAISLKRTARNDSPPDHDKAASERKDSVDEHATLARDQSDVSASRGEQAKFSHGQQAVRSDDEIGSRQPSIERKERDADSIQTSTIPAVAVVVAPSTVTGLGESRNGGQAGSGDPRRDVRDEPGERQDESFSEAIYDPDYFKKRRASRQGERQVTSAREVVADLRRRYSEAPQSMAEFFAPPELTEKSEGSSVDLNADEDMFSRGPIPQIVTVEPTSLPHSAEYNYSILDADSSRIKVPWSVPYLNLIEPTPPTSTAGSVRGDASEPPSPRQPVPSVQQTEDEPAERSTATKVTWGESDTRMYEVLTPESTLEQFITPIEVIPDPYQSQGDRTVEVVNEGQGSGPSTTVYGADGAVRPPSSVGESVVIEPPMSEPGYQIEPNRDIPSDSALDAEIGPSAPVQNGEGVQERESLEDLDKIVEETMPGGFIDDEDLQPQQGENSTDVEQSQMRGGEKAQADAILEDRLGLLPATAAGAGEESPEPILSRKERKKREKAAKRQNSQQTVDETMVSAAVVDDDDVAKSDPLSSPGRREEQAELPQALAADLGQPNLSTSISEGKAVAGEDLEPPTPSESQSGVTVEDDDFGFRQKAGSSKKKKKNKANGVRGSQSRPFDFAMAANVVAAGVADSRSQPNAEADATIDGDAMLSEPSSRVTHVPSTATEDTPTIEAQGNHDAAEGEVGPSRPTGEAIVSKRQSRPDAKKQPRAKKRHNDDWTRDPLQEDTQKADTLKLTDEQADEPLGDRLDDYQPTVPPPATIAVDDEHHDKNQSTATKPIELAPSPQFTVAALDSARSMDREDVDTQLYDVKPSKKGKKKSKGKGTSRQPHGQSAIEQRSDSARKGREEAVPAGSQEMEVRESTEVTNENFDEDESPETATEYESSRMPFLGLRAAKEVSLPDSSESSPVNASRLPELNAPNTAESPFQSSIFTTPVNADGRLASNDDKHRRISDDNHEQVAYSPPLPPAVVAPLAEYEIDTDLPALPNTRPQTPVEVRPYAESVPLPPSRPDSPFEELTRFNTPPPLLPSRKPSATSVPLRFRKPPASPSVSREQTWSSPGRVSPSSPTPTRNRPRHFKSQSAEFRSSKEFRPLYLVERNSKVIDVEEVLPELPPSQETSRDPSVQGSEQDYQEAIKAMEPEQHDHHSSHSFRPVRWNDGDDDYLGSQQTTPRAGFFPSDVLDQPEKSEVQNDDQRASSGLALSRESDEPSPTTEGHNNARDPAQSTLDATQNRHYSHYGGFEPDLSLLPPLPASRPSSSDGEKGFELTRGYAIGPETHTLNEDTTGLGVSNTHAVESFQDTQDGPKESEHKLESPSKVNTRGQSKSKGKKAKKAARAVSSTKQEPAPQSENSQDSQAALKPATPPTEDPPLTEAAPTHISETSRQREVDDTLTDGSSAQRANVSGLPIDAIENTEEPIPQAVDARSSHSTEGGAPRAEDTNGKQGDEFALHISSNPEGSVNTSKRAKGKSKKKLQRKRNTMSTFDDSDATGVLDTAVKGFEETKTSTARGAPFNITPASDVEPNDVKQSPASFLDRDVTWVEDLSKNAGVALPHTVGSPAAGLQLSDGQSHLIPAKPEEPGLQPSPLESQDNISGPHDQVVALQPDELSAHQPDAQSFAGRNLNAVDPSNSIESSIAKRVDVIELGKDREYQQAQQSQGPLSRSEVVGSPPSDTVLTSAPSTHVLPELVPLPLEDTDEQLYLTSELGNFKKAATCDSADIAESTDLISPELIPLPDEDRDEGLSLPNSTDGGEDLAATRAGDLSLLPELVPLPEDDIDEQLLLVGVAGDQDEVTDDASAASINNDTLPPELVPLPTDRPDDECCPAGQASDLEQRTYEHPTAIADSASPVSPKSVPLPTANDDEQLHLMENLLTSETGVGERESLPGDGSPPAQKIIPVSAGGFNNASIQSAAVNLDADIPDDAGGIALEARAHDQVNAGMDYIQTPDASDKQSSNSERLQSPMEGDIAFPDPTPSEFSAIGGEMFLARTFRNLVGRTGATIASSVRKPGADEPGHIANSSDTVVITDPGARGEDDDVTEESARAVRTVQPLDDGRQAEEYSTVIAKSSAGEPLARPLADPLRGESSTPPAEETSAVVGSGPSYVKKKGKKGKKAKQKLELDLCSPEQPVEWTETVPTDSRAVTVESETAANPNLKASALELHEPHPASLGPQTPLENQNEVSQPVRSGQKAKKGKKNAKSKQAPAEPAVELEQNPASASQPPLESKGSLELTVDDIKDGMSLTEDAELGADRHVASLERAKSGEAEPVDVPEHNAQQGQTGSGSSHAPQKSDETMSESPHADNASDEKPMPAEEVTALNPQSTSKDRPEETDTFPKPSSVQHLQTELSEKGADLHPPLDETDLIDEAVLEKSPPTSAGTLLRGEGPLHSSITDSSEPMGLSDSPLVEESREPKTDIIFRANSAKKDKKKGKKGKPAMGSSGATDPESFDTGPKALPDSTDHLSSHIPIETKVVDTLDPPLSQSEPKNQSKKNRKEKKKGKKKELLTTWDVAEDTIAGEAAEERETHDAPILKPDEEENNSHNNSASLPQDASLGVEGVVLGDFEPDDAKTISSPAAVPLPVVADEKVQGSDAESANAKFSGADRTANESLSPPRSLPTTSISTASPEDLSTVQSVAASIPLPERNESGDADEPTSENDYGAIESGCTGAQSSRVDVDAGERPMAPLTSDEMIATTAFTQKDIDFVATLAAGLEDSGFDPDIVVRGSTFHGRKSPPSQPSEVDSADEYKSATKSKKRKKKKGVLGTSAALHEDSAGSSDKIKAPVGPLLPKDGSESGVDPDFALDLAAGLQNSGFDPSIMRTALLPERQGPGPNDLDVAQTLPKSKKSKARTKKRGLTQDTTAEEPSETMVPVSLGTNFTSDDVTTVPTGDLSSLPTPPDISCPSTKGVDNPQSVSEVAAADEDAARLDTAKETHVPLPDKQDVTISDSEAQSRVSDGPARVTSGLTTSMSSDKDSGAIAAEAASPGIYASKGPTSFPADLASVSLEPTAQQQVFTKAANVEISVPKEGGGDDSRKSTVAVESSKARVPPSQAPKDVEEVETIASKFCLPSPVGALKSDATNPNVDEPDVKSSAAAMDDAQKAIGRKHEYDAVSQNLGYVAHGASQSDSATEMESSSQVPHSPTATHQSAENPKSPSRVASVFPELQRIQGRKQSLRKEHLPVVSERSLDTQPIKGEIRDRNLTRSNADPDSLGPASMRLNSPPPSPLEKAGVRTGSSGDNTTDLKPSPITVPPPSWTFPSDLDSAVLIADSPVPRGRSPERAIIRDSGFHEGPFTPGRAHPHNDDLDLDLIRSGSNERAALGTRDTVMDGIVSAASPTYNAPAEPQLNQKPAISVSNGPQASDQTIRESDLLLRQSTALSSSFPVHSHVKSPGANMGDHEVEEQRSPSLPDQEASRGFRSPSPVESTTKERVSRLFHSSPSTRQLHGDAEFQDPESPSAVRFTRALDSPVHIDQASSEAGHRQEEAGGELINQESNRPTSIPSSSQDDKDSRPRDYSAGDAAPGYQVSHSMLNDSPRQPRGHSPSGDRARDLEGKASPPSSPLSLMPAVDEHEETLSLERQRTRTHMAPGKDLQPLNTTISRSGEHRAKIRTPDQLRPLSALSNRSATPPLRRVDRSLSGDLRAASRLGAAKTRAGKTPPIPEPTVWPRQTPRDEVRDQSNSRAVDMDDVFEGLGDARDTPRSPTRPPSVRKRQSIHIIDLETRVERLVSENRELHDARARAEQGAQAVMHQREINEREVAEAVAARDAQIREKDAEIVRIKVALESVQHEVARLNQVNQSLADSSRALSPESDSRYAALQAESAHAHQQWQESAKALDELRQQHAQMSAGMEDIVRDEIASALEDRNAEIHRLQDELETAMERIRSLQQQILASKQGDDFLSVRDEDYFDSACQQLCQHVQQWVVRFSKFSDTRACRLSSEIADERIEARLDNAILDGSDVDMLLADRVRRRDVFMSVVMTMVWEYVFTRYLFGMDREQRQMLKSLEKTLTEIGPARAVAQWRAITLTLLSRREAYQNQRAQDTEAVVQEIYDTLATLLPPPSHLQDQIQESLRNIVRLAVSLSIEMRSQRAEYIMLPPLQPEYDTNGDLIRKVHFNASLMNERSGETTSNAELEDQGAVVKIVLFPLVVKKGDDYGDGEDEIIVCPAQVLVAKPQMNKKVVRVLSGAMEIDQAHNRSSTSVAQENAPDMGNVI